jgi:hypothetical protein
VRLLEHVGRFGSWALCAVKMPRRKLPSWPERLYHFWCPRRDAPPPDLVLCNPGASQGWVFIGDGDELGDSSAPPLAPICSVLIAQQLLCHGESLHRSQLTPRTSARSSGGGEGERRLCTPGWEVRGLELFLLGRDMLATDDGLGVSLNSIVAAKTLEPCIIVGHGEADLETHHSSLPGTPNIDGFRVARTQGTTRRTQRIQTQGAVRARSRVR